MGSVCLGGLTTYCSLYAPFFVLFASCWVYSSNFCSFLYREQTSQTLWRARNTNKSHRWRLFLYFWLPFSKLRCFPLFTVSSCRNLHLLSHVLQWVTGSYSSPFSLNKSIYRILAVFVVAVPYRVTRLLQTGYWRQILLSRYRNSCSYGRRSFASDTI